MRRLTIGLFLVAALLALAVGSYGLLSSGGNNNADAAPGTLEPADPDPNGLGNIHQLYADMITTGNTSPGGGGAQVQGATINPCLGLLSAGSTFDVDFILDEVSPLESGGGIGGYQFETFYDGTILQVNAYYTAIGTTDFSIIDDDDGAGGNAFDGSIWPGLPDDDGDMVFAISYAGNPDGEINTVRVTFEVKGTAVAGDFSVIDVDDTDPGSGFFDGSNAEVPIGGTLAGGNNVFDGLALVGQACPVATDLAVSATVSGPDPMTVSQNSGHSVAATVTDNGPETADISYDVTASLGGGTSAAFLADCTTNLPQTASGTIIDDATGATDGIDNDGDTLIDEDAEQNSTTNIPFTVHCTAPSAHDFEIVTTVTRTNPGAPADTVPANNTDTDAVNLDVTAVSNININPFAITPPAPIVAAGGAFIVDDNVDDDGDTTDDEDPTELGVPCTPGVPPADNDLDGLCNEDGGMVVPLTISKTIDNLGPYGPNPIVDALLVVQNNPYADPACGVSMSPFGGFAMTASSSQQQNVPFPGSVVVSYTVWLHCGPSGWGYDDDGDGTGLGGDLLKDAFIDEDIPNFADDDGDCVGGLHPAYALFGFGPCALGGGIDEDGPVTLPMILAEDCADSKNIHISDPNTENSALGIPGSPHDSCELSGTVLKGVHPFDPSGTVTIDEFDNGNFTAPVDNDCLVTVPCKLQSVYTIPDGWGLPAQGNTYSPHHIEELGGAVGDCGDGIDNPGGDALVDAADPDCSVDVAGAHHVSGDAEDQGGSPLAGVALVEGSIPNGAFSLTHGNTISDGAITAEISATATLRLLPGQACTSPGVLGFQLADADLSDTVDTSPGDDTANVSGLGAEDLALFSPFTWPTHLDALVAYVQVGTPTAVLWARNVGSTDVDGPGGNDPIPINELIFDTSGGFALGPWLHVNHIGDPDFDADGLYDAAPDGDDDGDTIPDAQDPDTDNDGVENSLELAQCSPLGVTQIALGTSQGFDYSGVGGPVVAGGQTLRVCNIINPINPPGSLGHTDAQKFTREDIGTTTTITSQVGCSGENDAAASICKDEIPGDQVPDDECTVYDPDNDEDGAGAGTCDDTLDNGPDGDTDAADSDCYDGLGVTPGVDNDADTSIDEDPTLNGVDEDGDGIDGEDPVVDIVKASEEQHINVLFDVENGTVPGDLNVQFSIVGPAACNPHWIGQAGDTVNTSTLGGTQTSTITRLETGMASGEIRYFERKYSVTCPPGAHNFNIYNNVSSASGLPDPDLNNNQAENELQIIATADVDNDGISNPSDSCNWVANSGLDTDNDGIDNACDIDDDGDGIDDGDDGCPLIPEDDDNVDDEDGCPDTDVSVDVDKDETYEVDVSQSVNKTVTITVTNGNYPANVQVTMLAVSTLGACEVRLIPVGTDVYSEFTTDENAPAGVDDTLWSQIERTDFFNAGEVKVYVRQYSIHCFQNSQHSFELAVDALPLNPVQEEDLDDNVHKNFPTVIAYRLADLKKVSLVFNAPPASVKVGEEFNLNVVGTLHNNGPTSGVSYSDSLEIDGPADCTWDNAGTPTAFPYTTGQAGVMNTSVNTPIQTTIAVTCSEQSSHPFTASNEIEVTSMHVRDHVSGNNTINTQANIIVNADADLTVTNVAVGGPVSGDVNVPFNVTVSGDLGNNGPENPVNADATFDLSVPPDCTKVPAGTQTSNNVALGSVIGASKVWSVTCTTNSNHDFTGTVSVVVDQIHVVDPDTGNNSDSGGPTNIPIFKQVEKTICDVYVGPAPVPPAPTGPAAGCPADPWNGGPGEVSVSGASVNVVSDDLDYSSQAVTVKRDLEMDGIAGGPQVCTTSPDVPAAPDQTFTEAEPAGLSTAGTIANWTITLPLPTHDGEPNWCLVEYTVTKTIDEEHVEDGPVTGDLTETVQFVVARDTDGDGVYDNALGDLDNCKLVSNADQADSNGNGTGDACDSEVDVLEKYITVLGPAAVNLSDFNGRYMWVIGEMGNASTDTQQVQISISITGPWPNDCDPIEVDLILPGQDTFLMLAGEQKFQVFRVRFECHAPATQQVVTLDIEKCIELLPSDAQDDDGDGFIDEDSRDGVDDDGDSEDGEDPPNPDEDPDNDCQSTSKQVIIDQP